MRVRTPHQRLRAAAAKAEPAQVEVPCPDLAFLHGHAVLGTIVFDALVRQVELAAITAHVLPRPDRRVQSTRLGYHTW